MFLFCVGWQMQGKRASRKWCVSSSVQSRITEVCLPIHTSLRTAESSLHQEIPDTCREDANII